MIRPATAEDCIDFAPKIAAEDADEIRAACGLNPIQGFLAAHAMATESWALEVDGEVVALYGLRKDTDFSAVVWLICSPRVKEAPITFTKMVHAELDRMSNQYGLLHGYADERNEGHLDWLESVGFKFTNVLEDFGPEKRPFYEFAGQFGESVGA